MALFRKGGSLEAVLCARCPRCRAASMFSRSLWLFPRMYEQCRVCGLRFEREPGYFLGAMYISYGLGVITIALFAMAFWMATSCSLTRSFVWGIILFVPFAAPLTYLARVLWIYFDRAVDPDPNEVRSF